MVCRITLLVLVLVSMLEVAYATSTICFSGDGFLVEAVLSDTEKQLTNIRVHRADRLIFSAETGDFQEAFCDPETQKVEAVVAEKQDRPRFELRGRGKTVTMIFGSQRVSLKADWAR